VDRERSVLEALLLPLQVFLEEASITEIAVNRPGEVWCERREGWERYTSEGFTLAWAKDLSTAIAHDSIRPLAEQHSLLSAQLPFGPRVQVVYPPTCEPGTVSLTIRKPSFATRTLEEYQGEGFFAHVRPGRRAKSHDEDPALWELYQGQQYAEFLRL